MSEHQHGNGIGTAKAILSLIDEHSAQDFQEAEKILGANRELAYLVSLLRQMKEREEVATQPLTIEVYASIVREELLALPAKILFSKNSPVDLLPSSVVDEIRAAWEEAGIELLAFSLEDLSASVDIILNQIHRFASTPSEEVKLLTHLLLSGTFRAGSEHIRRVLSRLREIAIRALVENEVVFPALHSIAQLRLQWAEEPLSFSPRETRTQLAERLLEDLYGHPSAAVGDQILGVLVAALRMPAEGAIAAVRRGTAPTGARGGIHKPRQSGSGARGRQGAARRGKASGE